ncbi:MAG TPA: ATP-binding protein [Woeseiaceae bacterium]
MKRGPARNRTLLFRLYLLLAIGLVAIAALLDFGFRGLQAHLYDSPDPWRDAGFRLIARQLSASAPDERTELAAALTRTLGMPVQLLQADDVVGESVDAGEVQELYDAGGRVTWLKHDKESNIALRVGPVELPEENPWLRTIPPLFYLAIFLIVGFWLRPLLRDLDIITASTRAFAADYREPQRTAPGVSSLKELAENFDAMSARLSTLIQGQKELTSALSHEMRTPLARIRFALAVVGDKASEAQHEELLAIGEDVQEMDRLIATMLNYARLDHPDTHMNWHKTQAHTWLRRTVEKSRLPEIDVKVRVDEHLVNLQMDERLMTLALSNLIVNACRHAESAVEVHLGRSGGVNRLQVDDDGEGIPEADRARVFKAFTRLDGSRNRDTGGYGLGLAIVARIANLHGGEASAGHSDNLGGASMSVTWPCRY